MDKYLQIDPWRIIERGFHPEKNKISESIFSLGNGKIGHRGNFEEEYTGDTLQGNYIAGIYSSEKTVVGWWKNGYPKYTSKIINAPNWLGIAIKVDSCDLDIAKSKSIQNFERVLNMKEGWLGRTATITLSNNKTIELKTKRFLSLKNTELGVLKYEIKSHQDTHLTFKVFIDGNVVNEDSNHYQSLWYQRHKEIEDQEGSILLSTRKTKFYVCNSMKFALDGKDIKEFKREVNEKYIASTFEVFLKEGESITITKWGVTITSLDFPKDELLDISKKKISFYYQKGWEEALEEQKTAWNNVWNDLDIVVEGDLTSQQGIRFNIFQLYQTYTGKDKRLNIGPKGFTGEKYGGTTYWDTEAFCLPFYLSSDSTIAKNLLLYRYNHLPNAINNAKLLGFSNGAALYPMVTIDGEECHNEWEITFEEIHRNSTIAFAIYKYINYTNDKRYLVTYGLPVLIAIARFWKQRTNFSSKRNKYVILGVTGPNEYENNVNNNWYTNFMASWCLNYTIECIEHIKYYFLDDYRRLEESINFNEEEILEWKHIIDNMYLPEDHERRVHLQNDGYLDKILVPYNSISSDQLPIAKNWSWDRILRSCYIKQADVLQGMYYLEDKFDKETIERNFDFYEPLTVHESSLSPSIHSIIASYLGRIEKAYTLFLHSSRMDLDNYNSDTEDGCHITSMGGSWMAIIEGFAGMRIKNGVISFHPSLPKKWNYYSFKIIFRHAILKVRVDTNNILVTNLSSTSIDIGVYQKVRTIRGFSFIEVQLENNSDQ